MHPYFFDQPDNRADDFQPRLRARGLPTSDLRPEWRAEGVKGPAKHPPPAGSKAVPRAGIWSRIFARRRFAPA